MNSITIGIIGICGRYGEWLAAFLRILGYTVIGADPKIEGGLSNREVVEQADVVLFAVPPRVTARTIKRLRPYARSGQLWADVTSMKEIVAREMPRNVEVVLLHPISAPPPELSLRGQTLVVCEVRLDRWRPFIEHIAEASEARIVRCSPEEHDKRMAVVQGLVHAAALITAAVMRRAEVDVSESLVYASPVYRIALSFIGRILKQDANLYADIQLLNPFVLPLLRLFEEEAGRLRRTIEARERRAFVKSFEASATHFGEKTLADAFRLFDDLNQMMTDREGDRLVTLRVLCDGNRPGVLRQLTEIFERHGVNLTSFHSLRTRNGLQFLIGYGEGGSPSEALKEIAHEGLAKEV